jgi:hypothetical protein
MKEQAPLKNTPRSPIKEYNNSISRETLKSTLIGSNPNKVTKK